MYVCRYTSIHTLNVFSINCQRTVESKKFTGIHDLQDVPKELDSLSRASKTFVIEAQEKNDDVRSKEKYIDEEEKPLESARQDNNANLIELQQKEIEKLKSR